MLLPATLVLAQDQHPAATGLIGDQVQRPVSAEKILLVGEAFSTASSSGFFDPVGTHFHSDNTGSFGNPPDVMEVGECCGGSGTEEDRGMCEIPLSTVESESAVLHLLVMQVGGLFGEAGGTFDIRVETYSADGAEAIGDHSTATTGTVDVFSTSGLSAGDALDFDVTAEVAAALALADTHLGIRLRPDNDPNGAAYVFGQCELLTPKTIPVLSPMGFAALVVGLFLIGGFMFYRRRRTA